MKICIDTFGFKAHHASIIEKKRLHDGYIKWIQSAERDYYDSLKRSNGLPSDWRSRVIK